MGILTFSDGREYIHNELLSLNRGYQERLAKALESTGELDVVQGCEIISNQQVAQNEGRSMAREGCDLTILNYAIWCYPHLSAVVAREHVKSWGG